MFLSLSASEDDTAKQIILKEVLVSATSKVTFCKNILLFVFLRFFPLVLADFKNTVWNIL